MLCTNAVSLLCLLELAGGRCTRAAQALLQHVGVCGLYPLVVILLCLDDLEAKFLVEVNGRLIADLHVTVWAGQNNRVVLQLESLSMQLGTSTKEPMVATYR